MFETRAGKMKKVVEIMRKVHLDWPLFIIYIYIYERINPSNLMKKEAIYYQEKSKEIKWIYDNLSDDLSKEIYKTCLTFRTTREKYLRKIKRKPEEQYFSEDVITLNDNEYFVDCGAYIGDTLEIFMKKVHNKYGAYYAFEPDDDNWKQLIKNVKRYADDRIHTFKLGISDVDGEVRFDGCDGTNSGAAISEKGESIIKVNTIDNVLKDKTVTFIKMDIEGAETAAINGAWHTIVAQRPKLAICIYHSCQDMVEIPYTLMNSLTNYKFYIRHYNIDKIETVFYAIPDEGNWGA